MANLSDYIEDYLKKLLSLSSRRFVDIQRGELAQKFDCVPSQINYVLSTRFCLERGYLVESRRGGRGFIRIYRVDPSGTPAGAGILRLRREEDFDAQKARHLIRRCYEERIVTHREARILETLLKEEHYGGCLRGEACRAVQRNLFQAAMEEVLKGAY